MNSHLLDPYLFNPWVKNTDTLAGQTGVHRAEYHHLTHIHIGNLCSRGHGWGWEIQHSKPSASSRDRVYLIGSHFPTSFIQPLWCLPEKQGLQKLLHTLTKHSFTSVAVLKIVFPHSLCSKAKVPSFYPAFLFPPFFKNQGEEKNKRGFSQLPHLGTLSSCFPEACFLTQGHLASAHASWSSKGLQSRGGGACTPPGFFPINLESYFQSRRSTEA